MNQNFLNYVNILNERYENAHKSAYIRAGQKHRKFMLRYNNQLFSRWYHSSLVRGTLLSPANLVYFMNAARQRGEGYLYPQATVSDRQATPYGFLFSTAYYSVDNHPAVSDLRALVACVSPAFNLGAHNMPNASDERTVYRVISVNDPMYLQFLIEMAIKLRLLKKIPAVRVNRFAVTNGAESFLARPDKEILEIVIKQAACDCAGNLCNLIPGFNLVVNGAFIESLLKRPHTTKDIAGKVYAMMVDSFQSMLAKGFEFEVTSPYFDAPKHSTQMNEQDLFALFTTGSYVFNAILNRSFFAVFSDFLKLIEPFYDMPFTFKHFDPFISANLESFDASFSEACSHYCLTPLACELFGVPPQVAAKNTLDTKMPAAVLFDMVPAPMGKAKHAPGAFVSKYGKLSGHKSLKLKITLSGDANIWKIIEISSGETLEQLHYLICDEFFLEPSSEYYFNTDKNMGLFTMYTPPSHAAKHKKTHKTALCDMPVEQSGLIYYCLRRSFAPFTARAMKLKNDADKKTVVYTIEIIKIKNLSGIEAYPRVVRESAGCKELNLF